MPGKWVATLKRAELWKRAALFGGTIGVLQVMINQGDRWLHHDLDTELILKSIASPLVTSIVAFLSAASTDSRNKINE